MIGFGGGNRVMYSYHVMEAISMHEVKKAARALKNGKAEDLYEVTCKIVKNAGNWVCN